MAATSPRQDRRSWRPPPRRRVRAIAARLHETYGPAILRPHRRPLEELVLTVLSQSTNDRNRDVAYRRLRERLPTWRQTADAPVEEVEEAIRPGGISRVKSGRLQEILGAVDKAQPADDDISLGWLEDLDPIQARRFLESLPGVGRKTAACVVLFSFGWPELPVDTHVSRTGTRLGLLRAGASTDEAHDALLRVDNPQDAYELHVNLLRHGRRICRPNPECADCALRRMCAWHRERRTGDAAKA